MNQSLSKCLINILLLPSIIWQWCREGRKLSKSTFLMLYAFFKKISTLRSQSLLLMLLSSFRIYTPKIHIWKWQFRNQIWEKNMQYLSNIHLIYDFQFHPFLQMSLFHFHLWLNKTPWCICIPFSLFIPLWWTCKMVPVLSSCESSSNKYRSQVSLH